VNGNIDASRLYFSANAFVFRISALLRSFNAQPEKTESKKIIIIPPETRIFLLLDFVFLNFSLLNSIRDVSSSESDNLFPNGSIYLRSSSESNTPCFFQK